MTCSGILLCLAKQFCANQKYFFLNSDVDECATGTDNCDDHAVCINSVGSFTCVCRSGYDGNGVVCSGIIMYY